jgi:hypothetical protein
MDEERTDDPTKTTPLHAERDGRTDDVKGDPANPTGDEGPSDAPGQARDGTPADRHEGGPPVEPSDTSAEEQADGLGEKSGALGGGDAE